MVKRGLSPTPNLPRLPANKTKRRGSADGAITELRAIARNGEEGLLSWGLH